MTLCQGIAGLNLRISHLGDLDAVAIFYRIEQLAKEILQAAILAEPSVITFNEQMAALAKKTDIRQAFLEIAREEKTHVGNWLTQVSHEA